MYDFMMQSTMHEFSNCWNTHSYLSFYNLFSFQIERCNYFLHNIVEVLKRGEAINGRLVSFLLQDPIADGGQWDMVVNIIKKYGLMPKKCFPMTFSGEQSIRLNVVLKAKVIYLCIVDVF